MSSLLIYGDTERSAALRHEVPIVIIDPFLWVEHDGRVHLLTNPLESARMGRELPDAELTQMNDLGFRDLLKEGMPRHDAEFEVAARLIAKVGVEAATVPLEFPIALADRLRASGIDLTPDHTTFEMRRRSKSPAELAGIRRAQKAAEAGMAAGAQVIREAERRDGLLTYNGEPLTAESVRQTIRDACADAGAPAPADIMVVSHLSGGGHDPGAGPLPADKPIEIDLWPRDEESGAWADMTRTFVNGEIEPEVEVLRDVVRDALEAVRAAVKPGVTGRELYDIAAQIVEDAGHPTQRTAAPGENLTYGFYFGLGHGVGLEIHEPPGLGLSGLDRLVEGDVIAVEPGIEGIEGIGGVRLEDLLLVTADGCETLTDYPYDLAP